jgi:TM2 domain-containing membrane protein YozV
MVDYRESHSLFIGYVLWIFGIFGAHRFYFGRPVSGTLYFFTLGLFLIGWLVDLILMPQLEATAERRYQAGETNYSVAWILLTFLGIFGIHRFYMGKIGTGLIYLCTLGLFGIGIIYDFWTLNEQISSSNRMHSETDVTAWRK